MHERNLRVSFTRMPAPMLFGWEQQRERQRGILEQAAAHFDAGDSGCTPVRRSRWNAPPTRIARWKPGKSPAKRC